MKGTTGRLTDVVLMVGRKMLRIWRVNCGITRTNVTKSSWPIPTCRRIPFPPVFEVELLCLCPRPNEDNLVIKPIAIDCVLSIDTLPRELPPSDIFSPATDDAKSTAGDKMLPIRHARDVSSAPIKERLVKMIGCLLAQATSFSGNANRYADNVATDEQQTISVRGIG